MDWIFVSDLHIGHVPSRDEQVIRMLTAIREKYPNHGLIHGGDGTDNGDQTHTLLLKTLFEPWSKEGRLIHVLGNHDIGGGSLIARNDWVKWWDGVFGASWHTNRVKVWQDENRRIIGLDTTQHDGFIIKLGIGSIAAGVVDPDALKTVTDSIQDGDILLLHHNPFDTSWKLGLHDGKKLVDAVNGKAVTVLFGHSIVNDSFLVHHVGGQPTAWCCADESPMFGKCFVLNSGSIPQVDQIVPPL